MPEIYIGCAKLAVATDLYRQKLQFVELSLAQPAYPKRKTLTALRNTLGENYQIALHASPLITDPYDKKRFSAYSAHAAELGFFQETPAVAGALQESLLAAKAIKANVLVFVTPTSFTPSQDNLSRFLRFFTKLPKEDLLYVWEPHGVWDFQVSQDLALEAGVLLATDPVAPSGYLGEEDNEDLENIWQGDIAYLKLKGPAGRQRRYTRQQLEQLLDLAAQYENTYVSFAHAEAWSDACAFETLLQQTPLEDLGAPNDEAEEDNLVDEEEEEE